MTYREVQAKARQLRENGLLPKKFNLKQKKSILMEAIISVQNKQIETATQNQEMTQEVFNTKLIQVYLEEKRYQELEGVVAITRARLEELFKKHHGVNKRTFNKLFDKTPGVFKPMEKGKQLVQLELEKTENGTYKLVENTTVNLVA